MTWLDARLPLRFGALNTRTPAEAVLTDEPRASAPAAFLPLRTAATHPAGCACCLPRSGAAQALATLFRNRALSPGKPFTAVLAAVGPANEAAVRAALESDPLVSARYRLAE